MITFITTESLHQINKWSSFYTIKDNISLRFVDKDTKRKKKIRREGGKNTRLIKKFKRSRCKAVIYMKIEVVKEGTNKFSEVVIRESGCIIKVGRGRPGSWRHPLAHEVLQYTTFPSALTPDYADLW